MTPPVVMLDREPGAAGAQARPRIGEILVDRQVLDHERLEAALSRQADGTRRLGDLLVAHGWASGGAVAGALAEQWRLNYADLESDPADGVLIQPEKAETYLDHRILPWRRIGGVTVHVTDRPETAAYALELLGAQQVGVAVAPSRQLDAELGRLLGQPLARRAASRTRAEESVRDLGRARAAAAVAVVLLSLALFYGGTPGLALALGRHAAAAERGDHGAAAHGSGGGF